MPQDEAKKEDFHGGVKADERIRYRQMLAEFDLGLEDRMSSKVGLLSGGQRQAITLLMATIKKPKLLLLDEHTAALDPKTAAKVLELSDKIIAENNLTALMVTHNMQQATRISDKTAFFLLGEVIEFADTDKLFSMPADKRTEDYITGRFG